MFGDFHALEKSVLPHVVFCGLDAMIAPRKYDGFAGSLLAEDWPTLYEHQFLHRSCQQVSLT